MRNCNKEGLSRPDCVVSIVIPWSNRPELATTLRQNAGIMSVVPTEVVIVNCGGDARLLGTLLPSCSDSIIRTITLREASFNRALALNIGAHCAAGKTLFMVDADIVFQDDAILRQGLQMDSQRFVTVASVVESAGVRSSNPVQTLISDQSPLVQVSRITATEFLWADGSKTTIQNIRISADGGTRSGPGLILLRKEHFCSVGGYNSNMATWGFEDLDLQVRLQRVLGLSHSEAGRVLHLSHGDDVRRLDGLSRSVSNAHNLFIACATYAQGSFQGTLSSDITTWRPRIDSTSHST